ncbi:MAG: response regulator [Enterocloster sp.]
MRWNPDIIISDIHMPVWDGLVMTEKLCKKGFAGTIYLLTGYAEFEYARKALQYHVEDYILKPVVPSKLRNLIEVKLKDLNKKETARIPSYAISYPMKIRCFSRNAWPLSAIRIIFWPWSIWNGNTIFLWRSRKLS